MKQNYYLVLAPKFLQPSSLNGSIYATNMNQMSPRYQQQLNQQQQQLLQNQNRPHTISAAFERGCQFARPQLTRDTFVNPKQQMSVSSQPVSPAKQADASLFEQSYSTIKRVCR